jgi:polysaccharide biosynthesis protein PslE
MHAEARTSNALLSNVLHVVFKRKRLIFVVFSVTVGAAAVGSLLVQPTYEAFAQVLVKIGRENVYLPTLPGGSTSSPVISFNQQEEQLNSEIEILKTQFLAEKVVASLGAAALYGDFDGASQRFLDRLLPSAAREVPGPFEGAVIRFRKDLTVEAVRRSNVIVISFKHNDPRRAMAAIDTLVNAYLDHHLAVHKSPLSDDFFQKQSLLSKDQLESAENNLERFKKQYGVTSLEEQRLLLLRGEAERRAALHQTLSQESETADRLRQLRDQLVITPGNIPLDEELDHNPRVIDGLQAKLVDLELKEQELLTKHTDESRLVQSVRNELRAVRGRLAEQEAKRHGKSRTGVNLVHQALQQESLRNEAELAALKAKKTSLIVQLADYQKELERVNRAETELTRLQQNVDVARQNHRLYLTKFEESRISEAMDVERVANVSLIEPARVSPKPVSPNLRLNMVLALLLGAVGAFGLAFLFEHLADTLEKEEDVEAHLRLPVVASIP